jgi:RimJ/RimL family protein N-acetyltransferase
VVSDWPPIPLRWPARALTDGAVVLDRMRVADVPAIVDAIDDEILRWLPLPTAYRRADALAFLEWQRDCAELGVALNFAVRQAVGGRLLGSAGLHFRGGPGVAEIGYWIAPGARGQGLATGAARLLAVHAATTLSPRRIELLVQPENVGSCHVAERAGAAYEGIRRAGIEHRGEPRDVAVYAYTAADLT